MKAVILAGGYGTRLAEETHLRPKPMVEIGGRPILWHIMKTYAHHGIKDFIICLGYKGDIIKEYFSNYYLMTSDICVDLSNNTIEYRNNRSEDWRITLIDTGLSTMTGGRLRRVAPYLDEQDFCFTYGDGVADINIRALVDYHRSNRTEATVTAAMPPGRFGAMTLENQKVTAFQEKPRGDSGYINAGYFVLNQSVLDRIDGDNCVWEREPLMGLASDGQLQAYVHDGFWQPMDTLRDKEVLNRMATDGTAPWICW